VPDQPYFDNVLLNFERSNRIPLGWKLNANILCQSALCVTMFGPRLELLVGLLRIEYSQPILQLWMKLSTFFKLESRKLEIFPITLCSERRWTINKCHITFFEESDTIESISYSPSKMVRDQTLLFPITKNISLGITSTRIILFEEPTKASNFKDWPNIIITG
jgi:hypothetical protein